MSKQSPAKTPNDPTGLDIEKAAESGQKSLAAIAHLHSRAFRDAMKFNASMLDFARRRVGAEIEASDRLCHCESVTDAMQVMTEFYQTAFNDYAEQTATLLRDSTEISATNAEETLEEASRLNGLE